MVGGAAGPRSPCSARLRPWPPHHHPCASSPLEATEHSLISADGGPLSTAITVFWQSLHLPSTLLSDHSQLEKQLGHMSEAVELPGFQLAKTTLADPSPGLAEGHCKHLLLSDLSLVDLVHLQYPFDRSSGPDLGLDLCEQGRDLLLSQLLRQVRGLLANPREVLQKPSMWNTFSSKVPEGKAAKGREEEG